MRRYGLATIFNRVDDGFEFDAIDTPLHLTHVDVLEIHMEPDSFVAALTKHLSDEPPFNLNPIEDSYYGPNKDIPVTLVKPTLKLYAFHKRLLTFLQQNGAVFENPQFLGEHYAPHISIYGARRIELGKPITINNVSVGYKRTDVINPPGRIIATIPLI